MMRYLAIILTLSFSFLFSKEERINHINDSLIEELKSVAKSNELEFVYGDKFPVVNPYGSYGSTYVLDFLQPNGAESVHTSALFLCRKKSDSFTKKTNESAIDLVRNYDYLLVFAVKESNVDTFEVYSVIDEGIGLMGMSLYYGSLDMDLSQFHYIDDPSKMGPEGKSVNLGTVSVPVVISSISSTKILIYYYNEKKWLEYVERDI